VAIRYILWLFGIFLPFWYVVPRNIWQPLSEQRSESTKTANLKRVYIKI
jgi:hypothetical protein